uniref:C2 NT-type domain-containing protein n=1 Tax=Elaeophora elaphi TaxID=1147741 RepID=A0A0R3S444_9BILA
MAFLKRRGYKFHVDLELLHLSDVPLVNAVLFAKVRLLNGGAFEGVTERVQVLNHAANWNSHFNFSCRIAPDPLTGVLERCACRISLRKEQKGGKSYSKLGFVDINLAQFAASGVEGIARSYLLDGYGINQRQDNSRILIKVTMSHQSADPIFKVPRNESLSEELILNPMDRKAPPNDDYLSQKKGDTDSADSSSIEDMSQCHDDTSLTIAATSTGICLDHYAIENSFKNNSLKKSDVVRRNIGTALAQSRRLSQDRSQMAKNSECVNETATRIRATRVDAEDLIDRMLQETVISDNGSEDRSADRGLALFVSRNGEAVVGANMLPTDSFERVHISSDVGSPLSNG